MKSFKCHNCNTIVSTSGEGNSKYGANCPCGFWLNSFNEINKEEETCICNEHQNCSKCYPDIEDDTDEEIAQWQPETWKTDDENYREDPINPDHYKTNNGGLEAINVIEEFKLGFCLGNVIKYVTRAGKKGDAVEDLRKAEWYLDRAIKETIADSDVS